MDLYYYHIFICCLILVEIIVPFSEEVLQFSNLDLDNIVTPVNVRALENMLTTAKYDTARTLRLVKGFSEGFSLGYQGDRKLKRLAPNLKIRIGSSTSLWNKVMKEVEKGRYAGPFKQPPYEYFIQSPIGLVPKDQGRDTRLIFHLSYPRSGKSINSETPKELCKVKYPDFNQAIKLCSNITEGNLLLTLFGGKSDMKSAFRNLPMKKGEFMLLLMKATHPISGELFYFVDKCLPFGASISCALFQEFSDAVAYLFRYKSGSDTVNYLDDYFFAALLKAMLNQQIQTFLDICAEINFSGGSR